LFSLLAKATDGESMLKLGFMVNPIAGMGGKVGLKGTDDVLAEAVERGAKPVAPGRGTEFLRKLRELGITQKIQIITGPGVMGEEEIHSAGLRC